MIGPFETDDDQTPITPEEREGLIPTHITLRSELNELEQLNVAKADRWAFSRRRNVPDDSFLRGLHRRMYDEVWKWAGIYRKTSRNIGVDAHLIETGLHQAIADARYWIEKQTYGSDELALRFAHRIVQIHPFPNGNGRWSRLVGDLLVVQHGGQRFTWGRMSLQSPSEMRKAYITALRAADEHDINPLMSFARS